ncbi:type II restriction endonuclease [Pumilibacter muris]|uniref:type II restriction endonuclease n=1 Tax=Pumilibacter muris TaxID=2941510 RepID=UPI00203CF795|nr:type II restriction endonuclease [Pumilibacter muris]
MKRNFNEWLKSFKSNICNYDYYVDFKKVYGNVEKIKIELNILNSLIGSKNIESDFQKLIEDYPQVLKCIPILLAVRGRELYAIDGDGEYFFNFCNPNYTAKEYMMLMLKTGLFDLIANHVINNLVDYVTGVEVGLDSNGRKNRGGHLMEKLVEDYLIKADLVKGETYFKEMKLSAIEKKWGVDLSGISNQGKAEKRFDFVVKKSKTIYAIETNFYSVGGSKLNETARSYKTIALEAKQIEDFVFVWFTDGYEGWKSARHNLEETFDVLDNLYCISDLENGVISKLFY